MKKQEDAIAAIARNLVAVSFKDLPDDIVECSKRSVLDGFAAILAGSSFPGGKEAASLARQWGGKEESTVFGWDLKAPAYLAAISNGGMCHASDFNDTHEGGMSHAGDSVIPAALAVAEMAGASGKELITAVALGLDFQCRLGLALRAQRGYWVLGQLLGYFGATAAAAKLLVLNEEQAVRAFAIALGQAAGARQPLIERAAGAGRYGGFSVGGGVMAALLAREGMGGARGVLEGEKGLFRAYNRGRYDRSFLVRELGKRFEGITLSYKPYPSCRIAQCYIDAALELMNGHDIAAEDVKSVTVFVGNATKALCRPISADQPLTHYAGNFSIPYVVALAIVNKKVTLAGFAAGLADPAILKMAHKVRPSFDPGMSHGYAPGKAAITLSNGRTYTSSLIEVAKGHPTKPLSWQELEAKLDQAAAFSIKPELRQNVSRVSSRLHKLDTVRDIGTISKLLA